MGAKISLLPAMALVNMSATTTLTEVSDMSEAVPANRSKKLTMGVLAQWLAAAGFAGLTVIVGAPSPSTNGVYMNGDHIGVVSPSRPDVQLGVYGDYNNATLVEIANTGTAVAYPAAGYKDVSVVFGARTTGGSPIKMGSIGYVMPDVGDATYYSVLRLNVVGHDAGNDAQIQMYAGLGAELFGDVADTAPGYKILRMVGAAANGSGMALQFFNPAASGNYNWQLSVNRLTGNGSKMEWIPSTAADGSTFSTAAMKLGRAGDLTVFSSFYVQKDGSDTIYGGANMGVFNTAGAVGFTLQLNAAQTGVDLWYSPGNIKTLTFGSDGTITQRAGAFLQLGQAYVAGVVAATGTVAIKANDGITYNALVHT